MLDTEAPVMGNVVVSHMYLKNMAESEPTEPKMGEWSSGVRVAAVEMALAPLHEGEAPGSVCVQHTSVSDHEAMTGVPAAGVRLMRQCAVSPLLTTAPVASVMALIWLA